MGDKTSIGWTDATWNPIRGCSRVSEGCRNCYAERVAARFSVEQADPKTGELRDGPFKGFAKMTPDGPRWTGKVGLVEQHLLDPLRWRKKRRIFVNSMSDMFHEGLSDEQIDRVFAVMLACETLENKTRHVFQILTKRAERMLAYFAADPKDLVERWAKAADGLITLDNEDMFFSEMIYSQCGAKWGPDGTAPQGSFQPWSHPENVFPLRGVWLGVSVEDKEAARKRLPLLMRVPAAIRFASVEPLLENVDLAPWLYKPDGGLMLCRKCGFRLGRRTLHVGKHGEGPLGVSVDRSERREVCPNEGADMVPDARLDWVIVGGESGPEARPCRTEWIDEVLGACQTHGVPVFVKQLGQHCLTYGGDFPKGARLHVGAAIMDPYRAQFDRPKGDDPAEWPERLRVQQWPEATTA